MTEAVETIMYKNFKIEVIQDDSATSPLLDSSGHFDVIDNSIIRGGEMIDLKELNILKNDKNIISLPVYVYAHSGIALSTTPFSCSWDSGLVGIIYMSKNEIKRNWGVDVISSKVEEDILTCMKNEIKVYSAYCNGDVYGYRVLEKDQEIDSCWGFYGYDHEKSGLLSEARNYVESMLTRRKHAFRIANAVSSGLF